MDGARGAAARELQRQELVSRPSSVTAAVRTRMATSLGTDATQPQDAQAYFQRHGRFAKQNRDGAYMATVLGAIWNHLELGQTDAAQALTATALAATDQWGITGDLEVGFLWTHLPEPPWALLQRGGGASASSQPYTPLAPPRWVAATVAYLKDMDVLTQHLDGRRRGAGPRRGAKPGASPDHDGDQADNADGGGKGAGKPGGKPGAAKPM